MEYIQTLEQLKEVSLENLGPMIKDSFDKFLNKAGKHCPDPTLIIETELKEPNPVGVQTVIYPISKEEWNGFVEDSNTMANYIPIVHVVDGSRFTAWGGIATAT